jgi:2-polyprenyl-6-hydroxyphenyl methylase/3-demethylubiquinone-9 3-methyltransferase
VSESLTTTIEPAEVAQFAAIAAEWWKPDGKFAQLHKINPARIGYIRCRAVEHFGLDDAKIAPFGGLKLLDIGCGGGLIAEPMARLGFDVTGIDAAEAGLDIAAVHADAGGLNIDYRVSTVEALAAERRGQPGFDVVLALEVVEHVADPALFLDSVAELVKPGGLVVLSTINRTAKALALAKFGAEYVLGWVPPGTHDWRKFLKPSEVARPLRRAGLNVLDVTGLSLDLKTGGWRTSRQLDINYMLSAEKF